ncbi:hypothetical protein Ddye_001384 [Dipteronia dyeriana]|uniref:Transmembrane protein n=1 Tax=Dipteronia dyeriana TaxID=168575 RepID=A0AAD9XP50_9ROSI|nr:hypothetical protein Ddye_001384 [Dipteronia dyeriana]
MVLGLVLNMWWLGLVVKVGDWIGFGGCELVNKFLVFAINFWVRGINFLFLFVKFLFVFGKFPQPSDGDLHLSIWPTSPSEHLANYAVGLGFQFFFSRFMKNGVIDGV